MRTRRLAFSVGLIGILALDLLALDDLTTSAGGAAEMLFLVASLPALAYLGRTLLPRPTARRDELPRSRPRFPR